MATPALSTTIPKAASWSLPPAREAARKVPVGLSLAASGLMILLFVVTRSEKQAGLLSWILIMVMSALGGSMFPAENLPQALQPFAKATLNFYAVEGYLDLLVRGESASTVLGKTAVLFGIGLLTLGVGQSLLIRRIQEAAQ